jgi:hypothetical protein
MPAAIVAATQNVQPIESDDDDLFKNIYEPTEMLKPRVEGLEPITDDNMGTEWTGGLYE